MLLVATSLNFFLTLNVFYNLTAESGSPYQPFDLTAVSASCHNIKTDGQKLSDTLHHFFPFLTSHGKKNRHGRGVLYAVAKSSSRTNNVIRSQCLAVVISHTVVRITAITSHIKSGGIGSDQSPTPIPGSVPNEGQTQEYHPGRSLVTESLKGGLQAE